MAAGVGLEVEWIPGDWRRGADAGEIEERLNADSDHSIKAVAIVHNETSTGGTSDLVAIREAIDQAGHPALLLADTISSLGSIDYRHDEWRVDVGVCCSQKGLMLPPGLGLLALSPKALAVSEEGGSPRSYWHWGPVLQAHERGFFLTHRPPICSTGSTKRSTCCWRKASTRSWRATAFSPRRRAGRWRSGGSRS